MSSLTVSCSGFPASMEIGVVPLRGALTERHRGVAFLRCLPFALMLFTVCCGGNGSSSGGGTGGNSQGLTFLRAVNYYSGGATPFSAVVADVNRDNKPDVVVPNFTCGVASTCVAVLLGEGDGSFRAAVTYPTGG